NRDLWAKRLLETDHQRCKYSRTGRSIFIRERSSFLQILPQHSILSSEIDKNNVYLLLKIPELSTSNKVFVPLIPGYCVFTKLGEMYFKLALEWLDNQIMYRWTEYANDLTFTNAQYSFISHDGLTSLRSYISNSSRIKYSGTFSAPFLFGLTCAENVKWLRGFISQRIPTLFQAESDFFHAQLQRDKILQQAKRKANKLEEDLYFNDPYDNGIIKNELPIIKSGWSGSNKITQALGVKLKELQDDNRETKHQLKNMKKRLRRSLDTICRLKTRLKTDNEESNESELSNNEYSNSENQTIKKLTLKGRLGSTVFVSTDVFLDLVLNQPCLSCSDIDPKNQKAQIKVDGLQIHIMLTCSLCSSETEYCNEREGDNFSKSIAGAGLLGGVNREEVRSILALLGVTKQSGHQQYFNKQAEFFQSLYQIADKSAENLLILVCEQLRNNNQDILEVSFDCAWSHVREALQASGEFIFNGELEESDRNWKIFEQPIMSFYTKCIYAASSRANNPEVSTPTDEELAWMYTEGLIYHLQGNHDKCWPKVCWIVENPDLSLPSPNLIEELTNSKFEPSFASLVSIFKSSSLKCVACQSFQKKFVNGLCTLCGFLLKHDLSDRIPNIQYQQPTSTPSLEPNIVDSIIIEFFEFEEYYEKQRESILSFLSGHDTLTILKTGGGKSLIYAVASVLYRGLTVVFTPQKALMDDQVREMVGMGIPAAMLYASSEQPPFVQEKIFAEIASGLIRVLFVTPEKYTENSKFRIMLQNVYNTRERSNMEIIRTSTIQRPEIILEVRPKPAAKDKLYQTIFSLLDNLEERAIIYGATVKECDDMTKALCKNFDPTIVGMYHGKRASAEQTAVSAGWKNKTIKIMSATTAFGMGINVDDVTLVIHTTLPMSHEQYIQEIGRAGRIGQESRAILFYSRSDIRTLLSILNGGQESLPTSSIELQDQFTTINTMEEKKTKIMAMMLYADAIYECRQQLAYSPFLWPNDTQIPACHICDNCKEREKDAPDICDVIVEALRLVKIVKELLQHAIIRSNNMHYVTREDVVDVFYRSKNNNVTKKNLMHISEYSGYVRTRLHPKKMCFYLLDSLIQKKVITQVIDLQRIRPKSSILTCTYKIIGVCENAESIVSSEVWQLYLK
ncbi:2139_t:CDS:2, partial [Dentiscutata heterogama]